jgi:V8-like Glu-specific endopeptidase
LSIFPNALESFATGEERVEVDKVRELISDNKLESAIAEMRGLVGDKDLSDELVLHQSRLNRVRREERAGMITREQAQVDLNKLASALLNIVTTLSTKPHLNNSAANESAKYEKSSGLNTIKPMPWTYAGLRAARSVCRVLTPGNAGTGFLIQRGVLITNHHVIKSASIAAECHVEFDYEQDDAGGFRPAVRYRLDPARFHTNAILDYTIAGVQPDQEKPPLDIWGMLTINANADPRPGEEVAIIQHPNAGYKQIAFIYSSVDRTEGIYLLYTTETMGGSSGSPVFNDSWHVVAIHQAATSRAGVNRGVLMSAILKDAGAHWPH